MVGAGLRTSNDFLLDTGIIIRYLRRETRAANLLDHLENLGEINVSVVTYMEILTGCRPEEENATTLLFERVSPVDISQEIAQKAALLIKKYPAAFGRDNPRGFPDALIAATAWQDGRTLVTFNTQHFARISMAELTIKAIDQNKRDWVAVLKM